MAKQNFVAGGFYGKLGALVGQRWKNVRVVKAYTIPANPRTEKQQKNRSQFATAIELAQVASAFNKGSPIWENDRITEFQYRTSVAKTRVDAGITGWLAMPLYPDSATPESVISDIELGGGGALGIWLQSEQYASLNISRAFTMQLKAYNNNTEQWEFLYIEVEGTAGEAILGKIELPNGYSLPDGSQCIGITKDDSENDGKFYLIPMQDIKDPSDFVISDMIAEYALDGKIDLRSTKKRLLQGNYDLTINYTVIDARNGQTISKTENAVMTPETNNLVATLDVFFYETMYNSCTVEITATPQESGQTEVVFTSRTYSLGKKETLNNAIVSNATLTAGQRKNGLFTIAYLHSFINSTLSVESKATYQDYLFNSIIDDTVYSYNGDFNGSSNLNCPCVFDNCPVVSVSNAIEHTIVLENEYLKDTTSESTEILDPTQTAFSADSMYYEKYRYTDVDIAIKSLTPFDDITDRENLICEITGQDIQTNLDATQRLEWTMIISNIPEENNTLFGGSIENVYPCKSTSQIKVYQPDFETADKVFFVPIYKGGLGIISEINSSNIDKYLIENATKEVQTLSTNSYRLIIGTKKTSINMTIAPITDKPLMYYDEDNEIELEIKSTGITSDNKLYIDFDYNGTLATEFSLEYYVTLETEYIKAEYTSFYDKAA